MLFSVAALSSSPWQLIAVLFLLSILPLFVVMGTSFLKLSVVFSVLRNALGIQQVPPNMALYGLALILSVFIMAPTAMEIKARWVPVSGDIMDVYRQDRQALEPYRQFLLKNTEKKQVLYFRKLLVSSWPESARQHITPDSLLILLPAFTVSQLSEAFHIGLLIYLPFLAIDLLISNILLAMGMMMVSPVTVALPFKLLIFILAGGWDLILSRMIESFR